MKKTGIRFRLFAAVFFIILSLTFVLQATGVNITREFMDKRFSDRISFLARYLALNAEVGVLINDRTGLKSLALNLLGEEDVGRVTIFDNQNKILVDIGRKVPLPLHEAQTPVVFTMAGDENRLFQMKDSNPFKKQEAKGAQTIGRVLIKYSTHGIDTLMESIKLRFLKISFILVVVGGIIFYFVSHPLVKEIISLARGAQEVENGNLKFRASPGSIRETVQLSQSFNRMLDSLEKGRKDLDIANRKMVRNKTLAEVGKFSLMVAHEFKNPLSIIKSSMDILRKDYKIHQEDVLAGYIEDEIRSLDTLIEDFLLFSKPAEPNFKDVDLNQILKDICTRFEIMTLENAGRIVSEIPSDPFWAEADADLLTRSISNIIKNALEADDKGGKVFVKVKPVLDDLWEASFEDQGPGIKSRDSHVIFEPFFTTKTKGTGLGLAFVSHVITAHEGSVTAVNKPDAGGAVFIIRIPLKQV